MGGPLPGKLDIAPLQREVLARAGKPPLQLTATRTHLTHVFWARNVVLLALGLWIGFVPGQATSPWVLGILGVAGIINLLTWVRLRQPGAVAYEEFLVQMLADVSLITAGLHHSGGDASSIAVLSFIPLTIAAATLPGRQTFLVFGSIFALDELVCHYLPGGIWPNPAERRIDLLAAALIAYFVFSMARGSRLHEQLLARMREKYLDQRHSAELGTLAAAAAHQLSTPLATLAVVVGELRAGAGAAEQQRALELMARQIDSCKDISSRLLAFTGHERVEGGGRMAADKFVARIVEKCRLMQPWMAIEHRALGAPPAPQIVADSSLEHAILVLLHSSPGVLRQIEIAEDWDERHLRIRLFDYGPVSSVYADEPGGTPLFAARVPPDSKHFDLLMARAAIDRFGGRSDARLHGEGALCMELILPLSAHEPG